MDDRGWEGYPTAFGYYKKASKVDSREVDTQFTASEDGTYHVVIDNTLVGGAKPDPLENVKVHVTIEQRPLPDFALIGIAILVILLVIVIVKKK